MKWIKQNRDIEAGEIIRLRLNKGQPIHLYTKPNDMIPTIAATATKDVEYLYGTVSGGFGCKLNTLGNAIFVQNVAETYEEAKQKTSEKSARWERYMNIEIIED